MDANHIILLFEKGFPDEDEASWERRASAAAILVGFFANVTGEMTGGVPPYILNQMKSKEIDRLIRRVSFLELQAAIAK